MSIAIAQLVGNDDAALVEIDGHRLHRDVSQDWQALQSQAQQAGFSLSIASAYRSFDRQLAIWNAKARGERPVLDSCEQPVDVMQLNERDRLFAILRWSALPGASRHHWGTDIDVYDSAAVAEDYCVQLTAAEVNEGGVFAAMHDWLDTQIQIDKAFGFYRPYADEKGGIAPERWHLSHRPTSAAYQAQLTADALYAFIESQTELFLREAVLENFEQIYAQYVSC